MGGRLLLLKNGASPAIQDKEGRLALHWAANNEAVDSLVILLNQHVRVCWTCACIYTCSDQAWLHRRW